MTQIRKATRKKAKLRLGISAPAGGGKTMSSLLLAYGITGDWEKIGLIDTEAGSGELYVGETADTPEGKVLIGDYSYIRIDPPFTVQKYTDAIRDFEQAGFECIIADSLSHAWSGAGGLLDKQGKEADRLNNSYTAWRNVTPDHNTLVDKILQSPCHMICTMRSKTEYVLETNSKGKQAPRKVGMAPVQRDGMEYEFTVFMDIDFKHIANATKDRTNTLKDQYFSISPATGKMLKDWLEKGVDQPNDFLKKLEALETIEEINEIKKTELPLIWPDLNQTDRDRVQEKFEDVIKSKRYEIHTTALDKLNASIDVMMLGNEWEKILLQKQYLTEDLWADLVQKRTECEQDLSAPTDGLDQVLTA